VNRHALPCTVLVIVAILISGLDIKQANYIVLGELPSRGTWSTISSVTNDLVGTSNMSTNSNSSQTANTTLNIPSNDTIPNSNITKESNSLNSNITKELSSLMEVKRVRFDRISLVRIKINISIQAERFVNQI